MFAESLLESSPHRAHHAAWTKLASITLQSAGVAIALAISLLHIDRLQVTPPPPSIRMTSIADQPVQVRAAAGTAISTAPVLHAEQMIEPNHIPTSIARVIDSGTDAAPSAPSGISCIGSCGNAAITNIIGPGLGVLPPRPPAPRTVRVSEMQLGEVLRKVVPAYPEYAKRAGVQGTVVLSALVGKDGRVESVDSVSGPPMLVRPAMDAVRQWRYRPYILNHEPVTVQTSITVRFVLSSVE
jgi:protein TonB